jgi:hypothetical protein
VWRPIGVAFERDRRHPDGRSSGNTPLEVVIFRLALSEPEAPTVVVDDDVDVIGIVERRR